jgi:predicted TIM-barrel fold metal-dependent hydrolase
MLTDNAKIVPNRHPYLVPTGGTRKDVRRADGTQGGQYLEQIRWQLLDQFGIGQAILTGEFGHKLNGLPQQHFATALATAYNDWLIDNLLAKEDRLLGSVNVVASLPEQAAREIDRVGGHPRMVQVILPHSPPELAWGDEKFHPIWAAAVRNDLPVALHVTPPFGLLGQPTGTGWPKSYMELRSGYPTGFQIQLISLVCSGVFEKFPTLRVALLEGGFSWIPSVMWRLDQSWRAHRLEVPWLKRRPSDYIRENIRFGSQPMEEPDDPKHLLQVIDQMGSDELIMFATDYPHWDFDSPQRALPAVIDGELRQRILWKNAVTFYGLPVPTEAPSD